MKKLYFVPLTLVTVLLLSFTSLKSVKDENEKIEKFLREMTDARMMDREEGREAAKKGTTLEIRNYGELMIKDQTHLLHKIQQFANTKNILLPKQISEKKMKALEILKEKTDKDFDKKFLKMISIDHKRDVKKFTKATMFSDSEVSSFASQHLLMIQSHLQKVIQLKENR